MHQTPLIKKIKKSYSKYFTHSKVYKAIRCTTYLEDINDTDGQEKKIIEQHENSNHRGIHEVNAQLKRKYYFPNMKQIIIKTINNCDICKLLNYDRSPPKIKYLETEIPSTPMQIIYTDLHIYNQRKLCNEYN